MRNVYFDITPPTLVKMIVTEKGEMASSKVKEEMTRLTKRAKNSLARALTEP